jgi:hypothetical protein
MVWPSDQLEALHACYIVEGMFAKHICEATFVTKNPDLLEASIKAHKAIADMYQLIGAKE